MSQENVEIVRRVSDAYNRRDVEAMLDELHPEIEWHPWLQIQIGGEALRLPLVILSRMPPQIPAAPRP